jgi:NAD(P)-dependent dehydrogenase (short-subunit alcohol dehydrogenase family)
MFPLFRTEHGHLLTREIWIANGGIGFELVKQMLAEKSNHVLLGSRSVQKGEAAVKDLESRKLPGTVELLQLDVSDEQSIANAAKTIQEKHGR